MNVGSDRDVSMLSLLASTAFLLLPAGLYADEVVSTELRSLYTDDFQEDSRADYEIQNEVDWQPGLVALPAGATIARSIQAGSHVRCEVDLAIAEPKENGEKSIALIQLEYDAATPTVVELSLERIEERIVSRVRVLDTDFDRDSGKARYRQVRLFDEFPAPHGPIAVEYRYGLIRVQGSRGKERFASVTNGPAQATRASVGMRSGTGTVARWSMAGTSPRPSRTDDQARESRRAVALGTDALRRYAAGKAGEAIPIAIQARDILHRVAGKDHPNYATAVDNLGLMYREVGDSGRAETQFVRARQIQERILGDAHPDYARTLNNLAGLYEDMGQYERAEPLYIQARDIYRRALADADSRYAVALNNLAGLYQKKAAYEDAKPLLVQALEITRRSLGEEHWQYAVKLNNLGTLYQRMGDYPRAEPLLVRSRDIALRVLGDEHPEYARTVNNLGGLYSDMGDFAKAEPLYAEARDIFRRTLGEQHRSFAMALNNLATLYVSMGDLARAEPLHVQSLEITKRVLGADHPSVANGLSNLAYIYQVRGDSARAKPLLTKASSIVRRVVGDAHPAYANILNNLAALHQSLGDSRTAESLYLQVRDIRRHTLGEEHPDFAAIVNNLGGLYREKSEYERAEPFFSKALEIRQRVLGEQHADFANSLNNLAYLYMKMGDFMRAEPLLRKSLAIGQQRMLQSSVIQTDHQQRVFSAGLSGRLAGYLSLALNSDRYAAAAFDNMLQHKGMVLERQQHYRAVQHEAALQPAFADLQSLTSQLLSHVRRPVLPPSTKANEHARTAFEKKQATWKKRYNDLTGRCEELERQLAARSSDFRRSRTPVTHEALLKVLPEKSALIDFLEFTYHVRTPARDQATNSTDDATRTGQEQHFVAFILRHGAELKPVDLGPAQPIAADIRAWRRPMDPELDTPENRRAGAEAGLRLRRQLWEPLQSQLAGVETVLISPDGILGRFPFGALPGARPRTYLIEERRIACVPVPRLLPLMLEPGRESSVNESLLAMGGVDYDAGRTPLEPESVAAITPRPLQDQNFATLAESAEEVTFIRKLYDGTRDEGRAGARVVTGAEATEAAFRELAPQSTILHLATHGYFADPQYRSMESILPADSQSGFLMLDGRSFSSAHLVNTFNPGLLSGLALAGANNGPTDGGKDDGILTSSEIAFTPLQNVDLVLLSACDTGLGVTAHAEGLIGVQRAFQVSGARCVIASLWKVNDLAARLLMERFYRNLWEKELSKLDALREAQLWLLNNPTALQGLNGSRALGKKTVRLSPAPGRKADERTPPMYWASFVLSGDWR